MKVSEFVFCIIVYDNLVDTLDVSFDKVGRWHNDHK